MEGNREVAVGFGSMDTTLVLSETSLQGEASHSALGVAWLRM